MRTTKKPENVWKVVLMVAIFAWLIWLTGRSAPSLDIVGRSFRLVDHTGRERAQLEGSGNCTKLVFWGQDRQEIAAFYFWDDSGAKMEFYERGHVPGYAKVCLSADYHCSQLQLRSPGSPGRTLWLYVPRPEHGEPEVKTLKWLGEEVGGRDD